jgi:thioredoxin 1
MNEVTDDNYKTTLAVAEPVLLDFWAPWCLPCQTIIPALEAVADEMLGRIKICKVNVDENSLLTVKYDIRSLPTLALIQNGRSLTDGLAPCPKQISKP